MGGVMLYVQLLNNQWTTVIVIAFAILTLILVATLNSLRSLRRENVLLKRGGEIDRLTGLYNRYSYEEKCKELINKFPNTLGAFFFIDLNDFKRINDTYGHKAGDETLIQFGNAMKKLKNERTILFRLAGDEFGIFRMGFKNRDEIQQMVCALKQEIQIEVIINKEIALISAFSAGGAIYNADTTDLDTLLEYADFAMYQAKRNKIDESTVTLFDSELYKGQLERVSKYNALETILEQKQIYAVYQPILHLESGTIYGYEGLSRTCNPEFSNICELIGAAEKRNKLHELDLLMMEQILRSFHREGILFINIVEKSREDIIEFIEKMVKVAKEVNISMEDIVLELSERTNWSPQSLSIIRDFSKKYTFQLALDDFGVGFSNSSLFLDLQADFVKIDRSFVQRVHKEKTKSTYIKSFIGFAKSNNMKIICEGIEVKEELEVLKDLGTVYGQGYYLGRPEK